MEAYLHNRRLDRGHDLIAWLEPGQIAGALTEARGFCEPD